MGSKQLHLGMDLQMAQTLFLEQIKLSTKQILEESSQRIINTLCGKKDDLQPHEQSTKQEREDTDKRLTQGNIDLELTLNKEDSKDLEDTEEMRETFSNLILDRSMYKLISQETLLEKGYTSLEMALWWCCEQGGPQGNLRRGTGSYIRGQLTYDKEETPLRGPCEVGGPQGSPRKGLGNHIRDRPKLTKEDECKRNDSITKNSKEGKNFKKRKKSFRDLYVAAL